MREENDTGLGDLKNDFHPRKTLAPKKEKKKKKNT